MKTFYYTTLLLTLTTLFFSCGNNPRSNYEKTYLASQQEYNTVINTGHRVVIDRDKIRDELCDGCPPGIRDFRLPDGSLPPDVSSMVAYVKSQPKEKMEIEKIGIDLFLRYPVDKHNVYPTYESNAQELSKIDSTFNFIEQNEGKVVLRGVTLTGYASPEATVPYNKSLSQRRASYLWDYIKKNYKMTLNGSANIQPEGEDWEGLKQLMTSAGYVPKKEEILQIMDSYNDLDAREEAIKKLGGDAYSFIYKSFYPKLRRTMVVFDFEATKISYSSTSSNDEYDFRKMTVEEWESKMRALTIEFQKTMNAKTIAKSKDPVNRMNYAAVMLAEGKADEAYRYLPDPMKAKNEVYEAKLYNNWALYYILKKDRETSIKCLDKAIELGYTPAKKNKDVISSLK